jgi:cell division septation protein DedD
MATNANIRAKLEEFSAQSKDDREWWDQKRAATRAEFMKELEEGSSGTGSQSRAGTSASSTPSTTTTTTTTTTAATSRPTTAGGSDEDTVLVEGGGPSTPVTPGTPVGGKPGKKKKGRK